MLIWIQYFLVFVVAPRGATDLTVVARARFSQLLVYYGQNPVIDGLSGSIQLELWADPVACIVYLLFTLVGLFK
jgi:hypothetical protein